MQFWKYHALGNDYLVLEPEAGRPELSGDRIRLFCDRHFGIGSDGILFGPLPPDSAGFRSIARIADCSVSDLEDCLGGVRIYNPDGSEAEKSGNGLRIFSRFLRERGRVADEPFRLVTLGGIVRCRCLEGGKRVSVEMGPVSFRSGDIPISGPPREVLEEPITVGGETFLFSGATVGNPHCVILRDTVSEDLARRFGPELEREPRFPNRTNVQFMSVLDSHRIAIEIWERGAGYTLASGSSASASAAVACRLGLCCSPVTVQMPGGELRVEIRADWQVKQTGSVTGVASGEVASDLLRFQA